MSDVNIHFILFLSQDVTREKVECLFEAVTHHYPMAISDCSKNDYIEQVFDHDNKKRNRDNIYSFYLFEEHRVKIWGGISNWERDTSFQQILFNGRRQAYGSILSDGKPGPVGLFQNYPSTGPMAIPFFLITAKTLDAYFGIAGHMLDFELYDKIILTSNLNLVDIIDDSEKSGYVHPKIFDLFEKERKELSKNARIEIIGGSLNPAQWKIIDGYKVYTIEMNRKRKKMIIRQVRTPTTLHDYDYVEELLNQYWGTFYFDKELIESIGLDTLNSISTKFEWVGQKGGYINCQVIPFGLGVDSKMNDKVYNEKILPQILDRIHKEYCAIGLY